MPGFGPCFGAFSSPRSLQWCLSLFRCESARHWFSVLLLVAPIFGLLCFPLGGCGLAFGPSSVRCVLLSGVSSLLLSLFAVCAALTACHSGRLSECQVVLSTRCSCPSVLACPREASFACAAIPLFVAAPATFSRSWRCLSVFMVLYFSLRLQSLPVFLQVLLSQFSSWFPFCSVCPSSRLAFGFGFVVFVHRGCLFVLSLFSSSLVLFWGDVLGWRLCLGFVFFPLAPRPVLFSSFLTMPPLWLEVRPVYSYTFRFSMLLHFSLPLLSLPSDSYFCALASVVPDSALAFGRS